MKHFKHIFIILFVLASCSTEMDSDLETAVNNNYVSNSYDDLPGTLYDGGTTTTMTTATSVSAGGSHTCAVLSGGTLKCWGYGEYGQLGNSSTSDQTTPVSVSNISTATSVSAGNVHSCAVISGGTVKCWGYGGYGQLGNGSFTSEYTPVTVK